jgi:small-conductance mechanosensitive channel
VETDESHLSVFNGTYSQRKEEHERLANLQSALGDQTVNQVIPEKTRARRASSSSKDERRKVAQLQELENAIAELEFQLTEIGRKLENPPRDTVLVRKWGNEYTDLQKKMDEKLSAWESLHS